MCKIFVCIIFNFLIVFGSDIFAEANRTYGPIKVNESLWSIATDINQSSDISIPQIMLAILYKNNQAFSMQNVNALEPGNIITYPDLAEIHAISKKKAYLEVEKQNKIWQNIVNKDLNLKLEHKIIKVHKTKHCVHKQHKITNKTAMNSKSKVLIEQKATLASALAIDITVINTEITKLNEQIRAVIEKNNILQAQLDQINTRVNFVEKNTSKLLRFDIANIFKSLKKYTQADAVVASCVISSSALLLFIIISLLIQFFKKNLIPNFSREECDSVLNKEEENIAKLNLARAYIDMGKNDESLAIINEVIINGDPVEKAEAESLLEKIQ